MNVMVGAGCVATFVVVLQPQPVTGVAVGVGDATPVGLGDTTPVKLGNATPVGLGDATPVKLGDAAPVGLGIVPAGNQMNSLNGSAEELLHNKVGQSTSVVAACVDACNIKCISRHSLSCRRRL